jgi:hypothetical protein
MSVAVQAAIVRGLDLDGGGFLPFMPADQVRAEVRLQPDQWLTLISPTFAAHVARTRVATGYPFGELRQDAGAGSAASSSTWGTARRSRSSSPRSR